MKKTITILFLFVLIQSGCGTQAVTSTSSAKLDIVQHPASTPVITEQANASSSSLSTATPTKDPAEAAAYPTASPEDNYLHLGDKENETKNLEEMKDYLVSKEDNITFQNIEYQVTACRFSKSLAPEHPDCMASWAPELYQSTDAYGRLYDFVTYVNLRMKNVGTKTQQVYTPACVVTFAGKTDTGNSTDLSQITSLGECIYNYPIQSTNEITSMCYSLAPGEEYNLQLAYLMQAHCIGYRYYLPLVDGTIDRQLLRGTEKFIYLGEVLDESTLEA